MLGCKSRKETAHSQAWAVCYFRRPAGAHDKLTNKEKVEDTLPKKKINIGYMSTHISDDGARWQCDGTTKRYDNTSISKLVVSVFVLFI